MARFRVDYGELGRNRRPILTMGDLDLDGMDDIIISVSNHSTWGPDFGGRVLLFLSSRYSELAGRDGVTLEDLANEGLANFSAADASVIIYGAVHEMNLGSYIGFLKGKSLTENYLIIGAHGIEMDEAVSGPGRWRGSANEINGGFVIFKARHSAEWLNEYIVGDDTTLVETDSHSERAVISIYDDADGGSLHTHAVQTLIGPAERRLSFNDIPWGADASFNPQVLATCGYADRENAHLLLSYSRQMVRVIPFNYLGRLTRLDPELDGRLNPGDGGGSLSRDADAYHLSPYGLLIFDTRSWGEETGKDFSCGDFDGDGFLDFVLTDSFLDKTIVIKGQDSWGGRALRITGYDPDSGSDSDAYVAPLLEDASIPHLVIRDSDYQNEEFAASALVRDVNLDGVDDLVFAAPGADHPSGEDQGIVYSVYGGSHFFSTPTIGSRATLVLNASIADYWASDLATTHAGFSILGVGRSFLELGIGQGLYASDINQDGYADFLVGTSSQPNAFFLDGYLFDDYLDELGRGELFVDDVITQRVVEEELSYFGSFIFDAGDVNGDGVNDVVFRSQQTELGFDESGDYYFFIGFGGRHLR